MRFGSAKCNDILQYLVFVMCTSMVMAWSADLVPTVALGAILGTVAVAKEMIEFVGENYRWPHKDRSAKYYAVKLNFWFVVCLASAMIVHYLIESRFC